MRRMKEYRVRDVTELEEIAKDVVELLVAVVERNHSSRTAVIALHGDLGSGKTTFMQVLARVLGVTETVSSPTFVIMKKYALQNQIFEKLIHIDAYRIENIDEMRVLGFSELLEENGTIIGIEWAEKIAELLPKETIHIGFEIENDLRNITIE